MIKLIAIPTRDGMVDDHFGHCAYYTVVTLDEQNQVVKQERLDSPEGCGCKSNIASVMLLVQNERNSHTGIALIFIQSLAITLQQQPVRRPDDTEYQLLTKLV